jgi:hypothetical protein
MLKRYVTVLAHKGYDIKVITPAKSHEIGYYVDGKRFNLLQDAVDYIDRK